MQQPILDKVRADIELRGYSEDTLQMHARVCRQYLEFIGDAPLAETGEADCFGQLCIGSTRSEHLRNIGANIFSRLWKSRTTLMSNLLVYPRLEMNPLVSPACLL